MLEISGNETIADHPAGQSIQELELGPGTSRLGGLRAGLGAPRACPRPSSSALAAETLDRCSHRLDAGDLLATRRPDAAQDGERDSRRRLRLGGEPAAPRGAGQPGVRPRPVGPQAVSAAILAAALAAGLTPRRPRTRPQFAARGPGAELLDGMRTGQLIGALLGYRLERGLRDRRIELAATCSPSAGPRRSRQRRTDSRTTVRWRRWPRATWWTGWPCSTAGGRTPRRSPPARWTSPASGPDRDDLQAEPEELDDLLDALLDLLMAEVHQMAAGNDERAGAALDALDRQAGLPDAAVTQTPRTGRSASHRLLVALQDAACPQAGPATRGRPRSLG